MLNMFKGKKKQKRIGRKSSIIDRPNFNESDFEYGNKFLEILVEKLDTILTSPE